MTHREVRADIVADEAQRARWMRWLRRNALDDPDREDFAKGGVARRAESLGVRFLVLPADPEASAFELDKPFWTWMARTETRAPSYRSDPLNWGQYEVPTSEGGARVEKDGRREAMWRKWYMAYRNGGLEIGLPARGQGGQRLFPLLPTVGRIWAALDLHRELTVQYSLAGPFLAVLGLAGTEGGRLVGFGQCWQQSEFFGDESRCADKNLLFCEHLAAWPDADEAKALAIRLGGRIEDGFGSKARRFTGRRDDDVLDFDVEAFD